MESNSYQNEFRNRKLFKISGVFLVIAGLLFGLFFLSIDEGFAKILGLIFLVGCLYIGYNILIKNKDFFVRIDSNGITTNSVKISWDDIEEIDTGIISTKIWDIEYLEVSYKIGAENKSEKLKLSSQQIENYEQMKKIIFQNKEKNEGIFETNEQIRTEFIENEVLPEKVRIKKIFKWNLGAILVSVVFVFLGYVLVNTNQIFTLFIPLGLLLFLLSGLFLAYPIYLWLNAEEKHEKITGKKSKSGNAINYFVGFILLIILIIVKVIL